jgi:hypothetical protein
MLGLYDEVLNETWVRVDGLIEDEIKKQLRLVWEFMILFKEEVNLGCDDTSELSKCEYVERLRLLAEALVASIRELCGVQDVTPYTHIMSTHIYDMVMRHGSLSKVSAQDVEALHQPIKKDANMSNRQDTVQTVLKKVALRGYAQDVHGEKKHALKHNKVGGHKSKADRELHERTIAKFHELHYGKPYLRD